MVGCMTNGSVGLVLSQTSEGDAMFETHHSSEAHWLFDDDPFSFEPKDAQSGTGLFDSDLSTRGLSPEWEDDGPVPIHRLASWSQLSQKSQEGDDALRTPVLAKVPTTAWRPQWLPPEDPATQENLSWMRQRTSSGQFLSEGHVEATVEFNFLMEKLSKRVVVPDTLLESVRSGRPWIDAGDDDVPSKQKKLPSRNRRRPQRISNSGLDQDSRLGRRPSTGGKSASVRFRALVEQHAEAQTHPEGPPRPPGVTRMCSYPLCPSAFHSSGSWKRVTLETFAGGQVRQDLRLHAHH